MTSKWILTVAMVLGLVAVQASATTVVDLRFSDGTSSKTAVANATYSVDVWVKITGTNSGLADGLGYIYGAVQSGKVGAGVMSNGGVISFALNNFWNYDNGNAAASSTSADGIGDWGVASASGTSIKATSKLFPSAEYAANITDANYVHAITNGTEFKVATLTFEAGSSISGGMGDATTLTWVKPTWSFTPAYQNAMPDSVLDSTKTSYSVGSAVQFIVPEPATMALLGLGALGLIRRRR